MSKKPILVTVMLSAAGLSGTAHAACTTLTPASLRQTLDTNRYSFFLDDEARRRARST